MASEVKVVGSVNSGPSNPTGPTNLSSFVDLGVDEVYPSVEGANVTLAGGPAFQLGASFTAIRVIAFRAVNGDSFQLQLTSGLGASQLVPCSGLVVLHVPKVGDEITTLKVVGAGNVEYFLAGT